MLFGVCFALLFIGGNTKARDSEIEKTVGSWDAVAYFNIFSVETNGNVGISLLHHNHAIDSTDFRTNPLKGYYNV